MGARHRDQIGHGVGAELDQKAVEEAGHLPLGEPRPEPRTQSREGLACHPGDLAHAGDLERALHQANGADHGAGVDEVAPARGADPQEIRDRHLHPHFRPDLGGDLAVGAHELRQRLDDQADPIVGRAGRRPTAQVLDPARRPHAGHVAGRHDGDGLARGGQEHVARPRRAHPRLAVEAREVADVLLGGQEQAVDPGLGHPPAGRVDAPAVLLRRELPPVLGGRVLEPPPATHAAHRGDRVRGRSVPGVVIAPAPPCRPRTQMLRFPRHLIQPQGSSESRSHVIREPLRWRRCRPRPRPRLTL